MTPSGEAVVKLYCLPIAKRPGAKIPSCKVWRKGWHVNPLRHGSHRAITYCSWLHTMYVTGM